MSGIPQGIYSLNGSIVKAVASFAGGTRFDSGARHIDLWGSYALFSGDAVLRSWLGLTETSNRQLDFSTNTESS